MNKELYEKYYVVSYTCQSIYSIGKGYDIQSQTIKFNTEEQAKQSIKNMADIAKKENIIFNNIKCTPCYNKILPATWIKHSKAEEFNNILIDNYECSNCHTWKREVSDYCPDCGRPMKK